LGTGCENNFGRDEVPPRTVMPEDEEEEKEEKKKRRYIPE
jgi:hypothetical protein